MKSKQITVSIESLVDLYIGKRGEKKRENFETKLNKAYKQALSDQQNLSR